MAEAPNLTTSKVRLWDRLLSDYNVDSGDGLVLHPETELAAIVMATDDYIVSSGNSLTLNADSVWSGNISAHVASEYCPLSKVVDGNTQYAEMYVSNGTATVTPVPTSTGYGTLINALSTTTSVGPVSGAGSATNDYIPTERAVALALEGKQQVLSGGACITLTPGANYTNIAVNIQSNIPLPVLANATQYRVPTEYVVRHAIDTGDIACSNYAYGLVSGLSVNIQNAGYATSNWCINTFALKGESPSPTPTPVTGDPATYSALGVVKIAGPNSGLAVSLGLIADGAGELSLTPATSAQLGGVMIPLSAAETPIDGGLGISANGAITLKPAPVNQTYATASAAEHGAVRVLNGIENNSDYINSAYVPNVQAVYTWVSGNYVSNTDYAVKSSGTTAGKAGIIEPFTGLSMVNTSKLRVVVAGSNFIGGVQVPKSSGLTLNYTDGTLVLSKAPVGVSTTTYANAVTSIGTGGIGGVYVMNHIESAANAAHTSQPVVPTADAVYSQRIEIESAASATYVDWNTYNADTAVFHMASGSHFNASSNAVIVENPRVIDSNGQVLYMNSSLTTSVTKNTAKTWYAITSHYSPVVLDRASDLDASGLYGWSSGTQIGYTTSLSPTNGALIYKTADQAGETVGYITSASSATNVTADRWSCYLSSSWTSNTASRYSRPIAYTVADGSSYVTIKQLRYGPLISGEYIAMDASITSGYGATGSETRGVVVLANTLKSAANATSANTVPCAPTLDLVYSKFLEHTVAFHVEPTSSGTSSWYYKIHPLVVTDANGRLLVYSSSTANNTISSNTSTALYAIVTKKDDAPLTRYTASDTTARYCWSRQGWGNTYNGFTDSLQLTSGAIVWATGDASNYTIKGYVGDSPTSSRILLQSWTVSVGSTSSATTDTVYCKHIADVTMGATLDTLAIKQYQFDKIESGVQSGSQGPVDAAYNGPFAVTSASQTGDSINVNIDAGYVRFLDNQDEIGTSSATLSSGQWLYLYGSSGMTADSSAHARIEDYYVGPAPDSSLGGAAGTFYIPIAKNTGAAIVQLQYGDINRETWGDDYRDAYNISRVGPITSTEWDSTLKTGYLPYKFIVKNGGKILGLGSNTTVNPDMMVYPEVSAGSAGAVLKDGLYLKMSAGIMDPVAVYDDNEPRAEVWLNIWSGKWDSGGGHDYIINSGTESATTIATSDSVIRYVVDTRCYEELNLDYASNAYSIQLGYLTNNGAPIQTHKGALQVRGRWI